MIAKLSVSALALLALAPLAGCYSDDFCDIADCNVGGTVGTGQPTSTTTSTTGSMNQSSSSTGVDPTCIPSEATWSPSESCGVFVKAGASGDGKPGTPVGSIGDAVALGGDKPIYVCAAPDTLSESVERIAPITLFGSLDCATWLPVTDKTKWTAPANSIPVVLRPGANGSHIEGFAITAANATGNDAVTLQGNSSIALLADGVTATLQRLELTAGTGANGGDAMDYTEQAPGRQSDAMAFNGLEGDGCNMPGGLSKTFDTCPTGGASQSGKGGNGGTTIGSAGDPGSPNYGAIEPNGSGGLADDGAMGWDCSVNGGNAEAGHPGPSGNAGGGGVGLGSISSAGYAGPTSGAGTNGSIGQGGGGGAGRRGDASTSCAGFNGPSGGSGGAGGCGGFGAPGGGAGGASIALLAFNATLTATDVKLVAESGGAGGAGGDGQIGGSGGNGANGGGVACQGGNGGKGGDGGGGGGGKGGPSIGLAFVGNAPDISDADITTANVAASAGMPGAGNVPGTMGEAGVLAKTQPF